MRQVHRARAERGIALPFALFALVVIGATVAGIFLNARVEIWSGERMLSGLRASEAALAGLQMGVPRVTSLGAGLAVGQTFTGDKIALGGTGTYYRSSVTRLGPSLFLLRSVGTYERGSTVAGTRTVGLLVKRARPEVGIGAAVTAVGATSIGSGSVTVDGNDHAPVGWSGCDPPVGPEPAIRTGSSTVSLSPTATIVSSVSTSDTTIAGVSAILDTLFVLLSRQADVRLTSDHDSVVNTDPDHPVIALAVPQDGAGPGVHRIRAMGFGVLLVDGDLELEEGSDFTGLILVRGRLGTVGGSTTILGSVIAREVDLTGSLTLGYSSCAVSRALGGVELSVPLAERGFIEF